MKLDTLEAIDDSFILACDLERIMHCVKNLLPPKCLEIFVKNKIEGKSPKEIAIEMQISQKTVENQIIIALRKLRKKLSVFF